VNTKMHVSETKSSLLWPPNDRVAEISLVEFTRAMKTFFVVSDPVPGRAYAIRYTGPPFKATNEDCRSLQVTAHAKGTMVSPLVIISVLEKFEIPAEEYLEAVAGQGKLVRMKPPSEAEPK
jgi:hypothetical protein